MKQKERIYVYSSSIRILVVL